MAEEYEVPDPNAPLEVALRSSVTLEVITRIADASEQIISRLQQASYNEQADGSRQQRGYTITEAGRMVGKTAESIRNAEKQGKLDPPEKHENNRRKPYSLAQVNAMRRLWNKVPGKGVSGDAIRIAFTNFKGGVGKTTLSCHCAQYFARAGYRVLLVDCDSQGSATATFGYRPDSDIDADETLLPYFTGEKQTLDYAVRATHWDGLDLIPANLELYSAEYYLAGQGGENWVSLLDVGLATIQDAYDVILIDPPPALGMISLSVLRCLDGLIVPTPPAMYDFHSTGSFFSMLEEVMEQVGRNLGEPVELDFVKILISKQVVGRAAHEFVATLMAEIYGDNVLAQPFVQSAEIDNSSSEWKTVYDLDGPTASRQTWKRCIESLDTIFGEVEGLINAVWRVRESEQTLAYSRPPVMSAPKEPIE